MAMLDNENVLQNITVDVLQHHVFPLLNAFDLMNLSFTCQSFHHLILKSSCQLWEQLYAQEYTVSSSSSSSLKHENDDWYQKFKQRKELDVTVLSRLQHIPHDDDDGRNWRSLLFDGPNIIDQLFRLEQQQETIAVVTRKTILAIHRLETCWEWYQLMSNSSDNNTVDIEMGAIMLSKVYQTHPYQNNNNNNHTTSCTDLQICEMLQQHAIQLQQRLRDKNIPDTRTKYENIVHEMKHFFQSIDEAQESHNNNNKFKGNIGDYYNYQNSLIDRILFHTKKGIPITLSIIYASIVRRATGIQMDPVGIPGHFLLSIGTGQNRLFVDAFDGGKVLTKEDCIQIVQTRYGQPWHDSMANPISNKQVWARMLRNLIHCHARFFKTNHNKLEEFQFCEIMYDIDMFLLLCAENRIPTIHAKEEILQRVALKFLQY